jgi:hypothetical protein
MIINTLKIKKKNKILLQRITKYFEEENIKKKNILKYFLKNKKINTINRFFYFLKKKKKRNIYKPIKNVCPHTGKNYINYKIGLSRFYIQKLLKIGKFNFIRTY